MILIQLQIFVLNEKVTAVHTIILLLILQLLIIKFNITISTFVKINIKVF